MLKSKFLVINPSFEAIVYFEGHFTHAKKRTTFFQNKRIFTDFWWIFLENKRSFAKSVRDFLGVNCPSVYFCTARKFFKIRKKKYSQKGVRVFLEPEDFHGFLRVFSWKQRLFAKKCMRIFDFFGRFWMWNAPRHKRFS